MVNFPPVSEAVGAGTNFVWTVRTNGVSTAITVTTTSSTAGPVYDLVHYAWVTNAWVDVQGTVTLGANTAYWWSWSCNY